MMEIGSKWQHKDGGVYEVTDYREQAFKNTNGFTDNTLCVWYKDQDGEIYVRTEKHFLDSFKPYEPVYEYRYALDSGCLDISASYYLDDKEFKARNQLTEKFQRLDFTKRERK